MTSNRRLWIGLCFALVTLLSASTAAADDGDCSSVEWSGDRPKASASADDWQDWLEDQVETVTRRVTAASARNPDKPGESFWLLAVSCGKTSSLWGVDVGSDVEVRFRNRVHKEYCCGAAGAEPKSIERIDIDGDGSPEFSVQAKWNAGGGVDYRTGGDVLFLVFPDRRVEFEWGSEPPSNKREFERDGRTIRQVFDGPRRAFHRYNTHAKGSDHILALTVDGSYNNAMFEHEIEDGEQVSDLKSHFCRRVTLDWRTDKKGARRTGFRQDIFAPNGDVSCGEMLFRDKTEEELWSKRKRIGRIEASLSYSDDVVRVKVRESMTEPHLF